MAVTAPTISDLCGIATFCLLGFGQIVTLLKISRDDRRAAVRRTAETAAAGATESAAMKELAAANERIAAALEKLEEWSRTHEVADERRWAAHEQAQKAQMETNQRLASIAESLSRQITNIALGIAPQGDVDEVPANRGRRALGR
jgi:hypothetical protein